MTTQPPPTLRIPFVRRCTIDQGMGPSSAMLLDLSLRGVYVATEALPVVGNEVLVRFSVPGNTRELELKGAVAWIQGEQTHPVHGLPPGFGLRFLKLDVDDVRLIARSIQTYCLSNPLYRQYL